MRVIIVFAFTALSFSACGGSSGAADGSSASAPTDSGDAQLIRAVTDGPNLVTQGMTPDEVLATLGEPTVRDMSDAEQINGKIETLTCWNYDHPANATEQDRSLQVCFRVDPKRGGRLYWAKRLTGASK